MLTGQQLTNKYSAATLEDSRVATEKNYYDIEDGRRVAKSLTGATQSSFESKLYRTNAGNNEKTGLGITLKVMAGDTIQAAVRAFYRQQATPQNNAGLPAEQMLSGLVQALVAPATQSATMHNMRMSAPEQVAGPGLTANDLQQLKTKEPQNKPENKPKAYLNYVFFDNQLNFVQEGSGVKQVDGEAGQLETLASGEVVVKKSGYVYVYTSNESQQDVLFDNLGVTQASGPILEETHYYPYGLTMAGISTVAPLKLANNYKYNGKELNHEEFSDETGLDWYSYGYREFDPQVGRLVQQDPLADNFAMVSPYQYGLNDPIANIDKDGLADLPVFTVTATAIQRSMPSVSAQFINVATRLPVLATLAAHGAEVAGNAINGSLVAKSAGNGIATGSGPEDWYLNNKTHQISWINGSGERAGYTHLGKTYKGYVKAGAKSYGFSGGSNGSAFLSRELNSITVSASNPCRYCLGGAGAYGPWNPDAIGVTVTGSFIFGSGASLSLSFGFVGSHFGVWVTPAGGTGLDVGAGISFFAADYLGSEKPSFSSYMGLGQSNNLNLGPFSMGQSADLSKPYNGIYGYGKNWETGSVGFGLYSSLLTGIGGSSQIGTSISILHF